MGVSTPNHLYYIIGSGRRHLEGSKIYFGNQRRKLSSNGDFDGTSGTFNAICAHVSGSLKFTEWLTFGECRKGSRCFSNNSI